jgi:hypothetical protein
MYHDTFFILKFFPNKPYSPMNIRILFCFLLLLTVLPYQAKAEGVIGSAFKVTKEKLKVKKPGALNAGVQTGYSAILRASGTADYPSILGTMRFSTIRTTQNPNGSGNVNIACGGSLLSGPCTATRNAMLVTVSYSAENFNHTSMMLAILKLQNANPSALLPSHWVKNIEGNLSVVMNGSSGSVNNTGYTIKFYTNYPFQTLVTSQSTNNMSVLIQKK